LVANGWKLRFFSVWPRDVHAIKTLAAEAGLTDYDLVTEYASAKRFIAEAQQCRIFLGFKLHATILAVCAGCATVALEYRPKVRDYMTSINAETWNMRLDVMTEHTLVERLERIEKVSNQVSKQQWRASKALADEFKDYSRCLVEKCALHSGGRQR
jgi:polysaccharide pyruvyl transferase WcaK-like protein